MATKMNKSVEEALIKLESMPINFKSNMGLCANFLVWLPNHYVDRMFEDWEHFSGDVQYPVPSCDIGLNSAQAYTSGINRYDRTTKYGKLRWKLVAHCIKYMNANPMLTLKKVKKNV